MIVLALAIIVGNVSSTELQQNVNVDLYGLARHVRILVVIMIVVVMVIAMTQIYCVHVIKAGEGMLVI